jgi:hypothetical protein
MLEVITIGCIMMLPMIAGGITFVYSIKVTKDIGKEID